MENIHQQWLTEKHTDFEYKQYVLLAYLKKINDEFEAKRLYPAIDFLKEQFDHLNALKISLSLLENKLSKSVKSIDIQNYKLVYQSVCEDDKMIHDITAIIDFALPKIEKLLQKGQKIIDELEQKIEISPVGLTPLICKEGYLLLSTSHEIKTKVFSYQLTFYENSRVNYRGMHTQFINDYDKSITSTHEFMKLDLIRNNQYLPNPATYLVVSELNLPLEFTFLPVAKIKLAKIIN
jgi:hypothetical protein